MSASFDAYFHAIWAHWLWFMSSGPFLIDRLITWFWPTARRLLDNWKWRRPFLLSILIGGIFVAQYLAWKDQIVLRESSVTTVHPGKGGGGDITGDNGKIIGGRGCNGGGEGGGGVIHGNNGTVIGGDAGCGPTSDGRGGKAQRSPGEVAGLPTEFWKYGRGGAGTNAPEYDRRLQVLRHIRREYIVQFPDTEAYIEAGIDPVPLAWINTRLQELQESWRVTLENGGVVLPPLADTR